MRILVLTLVRGSVMIERNEMTSKIWSAPVLEELTVDLTAIAAGKGNGGDGGSTGKSKS